MPENIQNENGQDIWSDGEVINYKQLFFDVIALLDRAHAAYHKDDGERTEKHQAEVCRVLGFTDGKPRVRVKKFELLQEYQARAQEYQQRTGVMDLSKEARHEIIDEMAKEHNTKAGALVKSLHIAIEAHRYGRDVADMHSGRKSPDIWKDIYPPQGHYPPKK